MIKIIIFDFDDTLVDNTLLDFEGFKIPCQKLGIKFPPKNEIWKLRRQGKLAFDIIKKIKQKEGKVFLFNEFLSLRKVFFNSLESNLFLQLQKGSKELLSFLKKNGIRCILCSVRNDKKII